MWKYESLPGARVCNLLPHSLVPVNPKLNTPSKLSILRTFNYALVVAVIWEVLLWLSLILQSVGSRPNSIMCKELSFLVDSSRKHVTFGNVEMFEYYKEDHKKQATMSRKIQGFVAKSWRIKNDENLKSLIRNQTFWLARRGQDILWNHITVTVFGCNRVPGSGQHQRTSW